MTEEPPIRPKEKYPLDIPKQKSLKGHMSVQTTERYLACKQKIHNAVNDRIGLEHEVCRSE
jgi:hypothetical protein